MDGILLLKSLILGVVERVAVEFSFFLSIPTMFAATGYDLFKSLNVLSISDIQLFLVGFITTFFSALIVIKALLEYVSKHSFSGFAYYRIVFGQLVMAFYWQKGWKF
jgi:undecaprenyl-diphosphatase